MQRDVVQQVYTALSRLGQLDDRNKLIEIWKQVSPFELISKNQAEYSELRQRYGEGVAGQVKSNQVVSKDSFQLRSKSGSVFKKISPAPKKSN